MDSEPSVGSDGAVWTAAFGELLRIDSATSAIQRFPIPFFLNVFTAGPDGLLLGITNTSVVVRFNTAGQIVSTAPASRPAPPPQSGVVAAGDAVWTVSGNDLVRWTATAHTQAFSLGAIPFPNRIASAGDFLWVASAQRSASVARVSLTGAIVVTYSLPDHYIYGLAAHPSGDLLVSAESGDILRITPDGTVSRVLSLPRTVNACDEHFPEPVAVSPDGSIAAIGRSFTTSPISPPGRSLPHRSSRGLSRLPLLPRPPRRRSHARPLRVPRVRAVHGRARRPENLPRLNGNTLIPAQVV